MRRGSLNKPSVYRDQGADHASHKGIRDTAKGTVQVHNPHFDAEPGDRIEFAQPNGKVETWEVVTSSHIAVPHMREMEHYIVKLRHASARPAAAPPPQVVHQNNYNIHNSTVGAVGENATLASSHVVGHATQWNGHDPKAIAAELKTLRKELAVAADGEGEDAAHAEADLDHVGEANKAPTAGDEGAFKSAMKKLSAFGMKLLGQVATAVTMAYLQQHGVLPTPQHAALPTGDE